MNQNETTLYIPVNIKTRFEFFEGFGFTELTITAIVTAISVCFAFALQAATQDFYKGVLIVLISASATAMAVKKNEINQSVTDMIILFFRFQSLQQRYKYEHISRFSGKEN